MNVHRLTVFCAALQVTTACGGPDDSAEPEVASDVAAIRSGKRVARGRGFVELDAGRREFKFRAVRKPNGKVRGRYTIRLTGPDLFFSVDVSCLAVEGNTAWVAGHIFDTNADFIELGSVSYFYAIDNGKGRHAPPDVVSIARFNDVEGQDERFCDERPLLLEAFPIDGGRVRIH